MTLSRILPRLPYLLLGLLLIGPVAAQDQPDEFVVRAREHVQKGRYDEAREALELLLGDEELPSADAVRATLLASRVEEETGHLDVAVQVIADALETHDSSPTLWARAANLSRKLGKTEEAFRQTQKALDLDSQNLDARLMGAYLTADAGNVEEAAEQFRWFVRHYNRVQPTDSDSLLVIAEGAAQYARWRTVPDIFKFIVNTICPDAIKVDPDCWQASLLSGDLLLEKYNREQAVPEYHAALKIHPRCAAALTGLARAAMYDFNVDEAIGFADKALEVNPQLVEALLIKADAAIFQGEEQTAANLVEQALAINAVSQETLARRFVLELSSGANLTGMALTLAIREEVEAADTQKLPQGMELWRMTLRDVLSRSRRPGPFLAAAGELLESRRHYDLAEPMYRVAIDVMPQLSSPRTSLGLLCMQTGRIEEAEQILEAAFKADPFHVRVSNMRKVLGVLKEYDTIETEHFVIRIASSERVLGEEMAAYLESIYGELTERYGFEPPARTQFEIYSDAKDQPAHAWFSTRMIGLPWIQTIGASTGVIVALASPSHTQEPYNWARVLRHEFVHILTLRKTRFQIPHWYTEALAVTEEQMRMPGEWQDLLMSRVPAAETFDLKTINSGFQRAKSQDDWQMAYCQSWLYAEYLTLRFGPEALGRLLEQYVSTDETKVALETAFDVEIDEFERGYREFVVARTEALRQGRPEPPPLLATAEERSQADPENAELLGQLAHAQFAARRLRSAIETAEKALKLDEANPLARTIAAAGAMLQRDGAKARELLDPVVAEESPPALALELRGNLASRAGETELAHKLFSQLVERYPGDIDYQQDLLEVTEKLGTDDAELAALLVVVALEDTDDASIRKRLARLAARQSRPVDAVRWAEEAIRIDVRDADMHRILAEHAVTTGHPERSLRSYAALILLEAATENDRINYARLLVKEGRKDSAAEVLRELMTINPENQEAKTQYKLLESMP